MPTFLFLNKGNERLQRLIIISVWLLRPDPKLKKKNIHQMLDPSLAFNICYYNIGSYKGYLELSI